MLCRAVHTGDKPFGCLFCDYRSRFKNAVKAHERTHTGERPFACEVRSDWSLTIHAST